MYEFFQVSFGILFTLGDAGRTFIEVEATGLIAATVGTALGTAAAWTGFKAGFVLAAVALAGVTMIVDAAAAGAGVTLI